MSSHGNGSVYSPQPRNGDAASQCKPSDTHSIDLLIARLSKIEEQISSHKIFSHTRCLNNSCKYIRSVHIPFIPGLVMLSQFEAALFTFLDHRANAARANRPSALDDVNPSWLASLFAVLAGGVQFSDDPIKERGLRSKLLSVCHNNTPAHS